LGKEKRRGDTRWRLGEERRAADWGREDATDWGSGLGETSRVTRRCLCSPGPARAWS
jgi:hypothetical protein